MRLLLTLFLFGTLARGEFFVQAHRGASAEYFENTLRAIERAVEVGADGIEFDVHLTKDGVLVLHHDFELKPEHTRDENGMRIRKPIPIRSLTYDELQKFDVTNDERIQIPNPQGKIDRKLPRLNDVFAYFRGSKNPNAKKMVLDIEVKSDATRPESTPPPDVFAKLVTESVRNSGVSNTTFVRSFDHRVLKEVRRIAPNLPIGALVRSPFSDHQKLLRDLRPEIFAPDYKMLTPELIGMAHEAGAKVIPFTVNDVENWQAAMRMGLDGVTTDHPAGLIRLLEETKLRNIPVNELSLRMCSGIVGRVAR